jgi:hypothetical protein
MANHSGGFILCEDRDGLIFGSANLRRLDEKPVSHAGDSRQAERKYFTRDQSLLL